MVSIAHGRLDDGAGASTVRADPAEDAPLARVELSGTSLPYCPGIDMADGNKTAPDNAAPVFSSERRDTLVVRL